MLLSNVRNASPPKADRLASFIGFGVVVQQLAAHLEVTGLTTHRVNPMLIQELTEKLLAGTQLERVRYRRKSKMVMLHTLSNFLLYIFKHACEVRSLSRSADCKLSASSTADSHRIERYLSVRAARIDWSSR